MEISYFFYFNWMNLSLMLIDLNYHQVRFIALWQIVEQIGKILGQAGILLQPAVKNTLLFYEIRILYISIIKKHILKPRRMKTNWETKAKQVMSDVYSLDLISLPRINVSFHFLKLRRI